jgi:OOP family OmpA-OmpF porin
VFGFVLVGLAACTTVPAEPLGPTYVVFFTPFSADLDDAASGVIADAGRAAQAPPGHRVVVAGYADRLGSADTNQTLSKLRAQVVADGLAARGVNRGRITLRPKGSVGGDPGVESRRVEIDIY